MRATLAKQKVLVPLVLLSVVVGLVACNQQTNTQTTPNQRSQDTAATEVSRSYDDVGFSYSPAPTKNAWWLRSRFVAKSTSVRGISAPKYNKNWVRVSELRQGVIPENLVFGKDGEIAWNPQFTADGDFNGDGKPDQALIGVYEDQDGKSGTFLLVLTTQSNGKMGQDFLLSFGSPAPIDLVWDGKELKLWFCNYCDNFLSIEWNKEKGKYEPKSPVFG